MILPADSKVIFTGPRCYDQAVGFVNNLPAGVAVMIGDGATVQLHRSIKVTYTVAEPDEVKRWARGCVSLPVAVAALLMLLFTLFSSTVQAGEGKGEPGFAASQMILGRIDTAAPALLAQGTAPDWKLFGSIVAIIITLAAAGPAWKYLTGQKTTTKVEIQGKPQPEPPGKPRWATWDEVEAVRVDVEKLREENQQQNQQTNAKIDENFKALNKDRSVTAARLHERLEATSNGLRHEIDDKIKDLRSEVAAMPSRLIELLKNTGAIGGRKS